MCVGDRLGRPSLPDVLSNDLTSLNLHGGTDEGRWAPLQLLDQDERMVVDSAGDFCTRLGGDGGTTCKVGKYDTVVKQLQSCKGPLSEHT